MTESCDDCPDLEVWRFPVTGGTEKSHVSSTAYRSNDPGETQKLTVIIAQVDRIYKCQTCLDYFSNEFKMPKVWWSTWRRRSPGHFGADTSVDVGGELEEYRTWFCLLTKHTHDNTKALRGQKDYAWFKFEIFTRWIASTRKTHLLVFDPRAEIKERLEAFLLRDREFIIEGAKDPFQVHAYFIEEHAQLQDIAIVAIRNLVRRSEIDHETGHQDKESYFRLHTIARHTIHVCETLEATIAVVDAINKEHDHFTSQYPTTEVGILIARNQTRMHYASTTFKCLLARSMSNRSRLDNEIQLYFNILSIYEYETSKAIGFATKADSDAMKTIADLTMIFLPPTFVCALFSTSFFNYEEGKWSMSTKFWVYWVVAIPVAILTFAAWRYWKYASARQMSAMLRDGGTRVQPPRNILRTPAKQAMAVEGSWMT